MSYLINADTLDIAATQTPPAPGNWLQLTPDQLAPVQALKERKSPKQQLLDSIIMLEHSVTPRRIREATLGLDQGWLAKLDNQLQELRKQLATASEEVPSLAFNIVPDEAMPGHTRWETVEEMLARYSVN